MSTEAKEPEPGQCAYEAYAAKRAYGPHWVHLSLGFKKIWAAVEQAYTVPAATQGGKTDPWEPLAELHREAGKAQAEWEALLNAARMVITAHTCKHPDLSREEAESRAMRALIVAVDAFPHPCAAAALPPPPSAPEGA